MSGISSDLLEQDTHERGEQIHEIASTVFGEALDQAGDNIFFAMAARDIFAAVVEAMSRQGQVFSMPTFEASWNSRGWVGIAGR